LNLVQDGDRIWGRGYKFAEDGVLILPSQRTPIEAEGRIDGRQVTLIVSEMGRDGAVRSTIRGTLGPNGILQGRYETDSGDSRGSSVARRLPSANARAYP
jgi:hypothetical protein